MKPDVKYAIIAKMDNQLWGVFAHLEAIDEALVGRKYLGRGMFREGFSVYREQGPNARLLLADIIQCPMNQWVVDVPENEI